MSRKFMDSASNRRSLTRRNALVSWSEASIYDRTLSCPTFEAVPSLKAAGHFQDVVDPGQGEICEHCGSPLDESATCWSCSGGGFQNGNSPVGAAPLEKSELSRVLRRGVSERALGAYSLSMQQGKGMAHLREDIGSMVEQFNASPQTKNSVKLSSERNAVKLVPHLGPTKAAIASVAQEFLSLGRSVGEASLFISKVHPRVGRLMLRQAIHCELLS